MRIEVIGGGSLGQLFAAGAAKGGGKTVLYTRTAEQARVVASSGIEVQSPEDGQSWKIGGPALGAQAVDGFSGSAVEARWVMLAVKQKHVDESLIGLLRAGLGSGDRLLCLQNGIGHMERLAEALPEIPIYAAVTTEGARRLGSASVLHAGKGSTLFGLPDNSPAFDLSEREYMEKMLVETFRRAGMSISASNEIETVIYRKLLINAVINPLTAIWKVENGELLIEESRIAMMRAVFDEIMDVYSSAGIATSVDWWEELLGVCRATAHNRSSMLEDVTRGDRTEAAWISGGIAALAARFHREAPRNRMLLELIEGMS